MSDIETTETAETTETTERNSRRSIVGVVVSNKMSKTIKVDLVRRVPHPKFRKIVKRSTTVFAHDEKEEANVGDKVVVMETRPVSKKKCWRLVEVLSH
jgi:small subunit ribosomal protein S17